MPKPWNVEVRVSGAPRRESDKLKEAFEESPFPELRLVHELEQNAFERRAIAVSDDGLRFMFGRLGLPAHEIPAHRVHVVSEQDLRRIAGRDESGGITTYGHVYLGRNPDRARFYGMLTHELVHAASYYQLHVRRVGERGIGLSNRRMGFGFSPKETGPDAPAMFAGLNEGVTELMAHHLRRVIADQGTGLDEEQTRRMNRDVFYGPWVRIVSAVPRIIAAASRESQDDVATNLYRDYVTGSYGILKRLEQARPGVVRRLRTLGAGRSDALVAAQALGLVDLARELRHRAA